MMPRLDAFWSCYVVAKHEFVVNLKSTRIIVLSAILALTVLGGAYGLAVISKDPALAPIEKVGQVLSEGPDTVLFVSVSLIALVGSIAAITLTFDGIVKERVFGNLDYLLSRPLSRRSLASGKFIGTIAAFAVPVIPICGLALVIVTNVTGRAPSGTMVIGYVLLTLVFLATFILLQLIVSTLSRSIGTSVLYGIVLWLFFTLFWSLVPLATAHVLGFNVDPTLGDTSAYEHLQTRLDMLNPIGVYDLAMGKLAGGNAATPGMPYWLPFLAMALWLIVPFVVLMFTVERI